MSIDMTSKVLSKAKLNLQEDKFLKAITLAVENGELKMSVAFRMIREIQ